MNDKDEGLLVLAGRLASAALFVGAALQLGACASSPGSLAESLTAPKAEAEAKLGIRIAGLHLSAYGYVLDLRYRVVDKERAALLLDSKKKVYLLDEKNGAALGVPRSPKIGGMRQTARNNVIYTDRDYFILFVNPGRAVRPGDVLKLAVDDTTIGELKVE